MLSMELRKYHTLTHSLTLEINTYDAVHTVGNIHDWLDHLFNAKTLTGTSVRLPLRSLLFFAAIFCPSYFIYFLSEWNLSGQLFGWLVCINKFRIARCTWCSRCLVDTENIFFCFRKLSKSIFVNWPKKEVNEKYPCKKKERKNLGFV